MTLKIYPPNGERLGSASPLGDACGPRSALIVLGSFVASGLTASIAIAPPHKPTN